MKLPLARTPIPMSEGGHDAQTALGYLKVSLSLDAARESIYRRYMSSTDTQDIDEKLRRSYQRLLSSDKANTILATIWAASPFVSDQDSLVLGFNWLHKSHSLTIHGLAVSLAQSPADVSALNSYIRTIIIAAAAFNLVERFGPNPKRMTISGTLLLHELMLRLSDAYGIIIRDALTNQENDPPIRSPTNQPN